MPVKITTSDMVTAEHMNSACYYCALEQPHTWAMHLDALALTQGRQIRGRKW